MNWRTVPGPAALGWALFAVILFALEPAEVPITDPQLRQAVGERASLTPDLWLPTLGLSDRTVIDLGATNDLRVLGFGLFDAEVDPETALGEVTGSASLGWFVALMAIIEAFLAWAFRQRDEKLVRPLVRAAGIFIVIWSFYGHEPFWDWMLRGLFPRSPDLLYNSNTLISLAGQHLELVVFSSIITIAIGLTLGITVTRGAFREFLPLVSDVVNSGQTVPTLAIVAIMAPIIGFGFWPAVVALILYGLLPVVRNTIVGLEGVDPSMIDAAKGMGMTGSQILLQIEIPSASSIILAGVRTSVVINVGTAALGAYVGSGGLGNPIASGLNQSIDPWVLLGALAAALLAILLDYVLGRVEYVLTPKGLQIEG
ncbi:MAG: ABC transporter permease [Trueperaceae bacterium]|nr:ABC transporter permease [Trueperaceae bacterium]